MVAMRLIAPQDRKAISEWVDDQADSSKGREIIASLPALKPGEGWVWAPLAGVLDRVMFSLPKTFDSSRAPEMKDGKGPTLTPINLDALKGRLTTVETEAKANDPRVLKARIRELETQARSNDAKFEMNPATLAKEKQAAYSEGFQAGGAKYQPTIQFMVKALKQITKDSKQASEGIEIVLAPRVKYRGYGEPRKTGGTGVDVEVPVSQDPKTIDRLSRNGSRAAAEQAESTTKHFARYEGAQPKKNAPSGGGARRILIALAQVHPNGISARTLAARAGMAQSGSFRTYLSGLATSGYINRGHEISITQEGLTNLGSFEPLPLGRDLLTYWLNSAQVGSSHGRILRALADHPGQTMTTDELCAATGFSNSGSFRTYLSKLNTLQLICRQNGQVTLSEELI
jgi:uncharacterized protein